MSSGETKSIQLEVSITSQRSNKMIEEARIYPSHELIVTKKIDEICKQIETKKENASEENAKNITEDIELIRNGDYISKVDKYFNEFMISNRLLWNTLEKII